MKKILLVLGAALISFSSVNTAYAGSLNTYEKQVVSAAQGRFSYQGMEYKLDQSYINQLIEYLSADDMDLTKEQRDAVLNSMYDYVETGVEEGYLIPTAGQESDQISSEPDQPDSASTDNSEDAVDGSQTVSGSQTDSTEGTDADGGNNSTADGSTGTASENEATDANEFLGGLLSNNSESSAQNTTDSNSNTNETDTSIVKNTGFNLNTTAVIAIMMGVLMLAGIIVTKQNNYFARDDE